MLEPQDDDIPIEEIREVLRHHFSKPVASRLSRWSMELPSQYELPMPRPVSSPRSLQGIPTGFTDLDNFLGGLKPEQVVSFVSDSGGGGSTLALNLVRKALQKGAARPLRLAVYAPQQRKEMLVKRLLCAEARIDTHYVATGFLHDDDWGRFTKAAETLYLNNGDAHFMDRSGATVSELRRELTLLKRSGKLDVLILDGLEDIGVQGSGKQPPFVETMEALKALAEELSIPVVLFCRYDSRRRSLLEAPPRISDVPPAVSILSDAIILLHRPDHWRRATEEEWELLNEKGLELVNDGVC